MINDASLNQICEPLLTQKQMLTQPQSCTPTAQTDAFAASWWFSRHRQKLQEIEQRKNKLNLAFLGDSITHAWEQSGALAWQQYFDASGAINLGFNGDRTENLLWRLQAKQMQLIAPKIALLLIGTNNIGHRKDTPAQVAAGVQCILQQIKHNWPNCKILLFAILPRGKRPTTPLRKLVVQSNQLIEPLADGKNICWVDLAPLFLDSKQLIHEDMMPDMLHPTAAQYWRIAEAIWPHIQLALN